MYCTSHPPLDVPPVGPAGAATPIQLLLQSWAAGGHLCLHPQSQYLPNAVQQATAHDESMLLDLQDVCCQVLASESLYVYDSD